MDGARPAADRLRGNARRAFADRYHVPAVKTLLEHRPAVDEYVIDAAVELPFSMYPSTILKWSPSAEDIRMLVRDATIVQDDVVLFCPADGVVIAGGKFDCQLRPFGSVIFIVEFTFKGNCNS